MPDAALINPIDGSAIGERFDQPGHGEAGTFPGPTSGYYGAGSCSNNSFGDPAYRGLKPMEIDSMQQRHNEHTGLCWTACHDDACYIHLSDKEGSGWFPRIPKSAAKRQREFQKQRELEAEVAADQAGSSNSLVKSISKDIINPHSNNSTQQHTHIALPQPVKVNGHRLIAMADPGATCNL